MTIAPIPALGPSLESLGPDRPTPSEDAARRDELRRVATEFESVFLAQMLRHAGVGKSPEGFDGGPGEDAFADMLTGEQAKLMAGKGGFGIAEQLFQSLLEKEGLTDGR